MIPALPVLRRAILRSVFTLLIAFKFSGSAFAQLYDVQTPNWQLFFASCGNPVSFYSNGFNPEKLYLQLSEGVVQEWFTVNSLKYSKDTAKTKHGVLMRFTANFQNNSISKQITMSIHFKDGEKDSVLWQKNYYVVQLPDPIAFIADTLRGGNISKEKLMKQTTVNIYMPDFPLYASWYVFSFDVQYISNEKVVKNFSIEKNMFSSDLIMQIAACESGDTFIFKNIKVKGLDAYERNMNTMIFTIE